MSLAPFRATSVRRASQATLDARAGKRYGYGRSDVKSVSYSPRTGASLPSTALARVLRRELDADPPRASSLIVTVWGDSIAPAREEVWLSTLFRLLAPLRVNERAVRTGIFRLSRSGWFEADAVGRRSRYRLTASGIEGFEQAFHRVYDPPFGRWDGRWQGVIVAMDEIGAAARTRV